MTDIIYTENFTAITLTAPLSPKDEYIYNMTIYSVALLKLDFLFLHKLNFLAWLPWYTILNTSRTYHGEAHQEGKVLPELNLESEAISSIPS